MRKRTRIASFWPTVHTDPEITATENLKTGLRVEKSENTALPFLCGRRIRILSETMTPSPHPSDLRTPRHITTPTAMADDCLCLCFLQFAHLVVECESQQQFDLIIDPYKRFWFPGTSHFRLPLVFGSSFYCLFVNSAQALCAAPSPLLFFGEFQAPPRGLEYELQRTESFSVDPCGRRYSWNDAEEDRGKKRLFLVRVDKVLKCCPTFFGSVNLTVR